MWIRSRLFLVTFLLLAVVAVVAGNLTIGPKATFIVAVVIIQIAVPSIILGLSIHLVRRLWSAPALYPSWRVGLLIASTGSLLLWLFCMFVPGMYTGEYSGELKVERLYWQLSHLPQSQRDSSTALTDLIRLARTTPDAECKMDVEAKLKMLGIYNPQSPM